jgi:hypothetical protein
LKSVSFESDISLWSSTIELKFWADIEDIYLMCLPKSQGFCCCWERVVSHFVFRSQFEVTSRKWQDLSFYDVKWAKHLREGSKHSVLCFIKILDRSKVICVWSSFAKLLWQKFVLRRHQSKVLKWSKYNLGELEGVWRLGSANTLSRPSYKSVVCNHVFNTIRNIIWDTYLYVKPMYSIKFRIIFKTYIHM